MVTSEIIIKWLQYNFSFNSEPVLLLLDEFTGHGTEEVAAAAKQLNVHILAIPPGTTSKTQPAEISWNKPFKGYMRQQWTNRLIEELKQKGEGFQPTAPSRDNILKWIKEAWSYLTKDTIINGFVKGGVIERTLDRPLEDQEVVEQDTESLIRAVERISTVASFDDDGSIE